MIDVRTRGEWEQARIDGAIHVPYDRLAEVAAIAPGGSYLPYGATREDTEAAEAVLEALGYEVLAPPGGFDDLVARSVARGHHSLVARDAPVEPDEG